MATLITLFCSVLAYQQDRSLHNKVVTSSVTGYKTNLWFQHFVSDVWISSVRLLANERTKQRCSREVT